MLYLEVGGYEMKELRGLAPLSQLRNKVKDSPSATMSMKQTVAFIEVTSQPSVPLPSPVLQHPSFVD